MVCSITVIKQTFFYGKVLEKSLMLALEKLLKLFLSHSKYVLEKVWDNNRMLYGIYIYIFFEGGGGGGGGGGYGRCSTIVPEQSM